jgi:transposase-like protein
MRSWFGNRAGPGRGLRLAGEGGLLQRLTKLVVESALDGELDDHLGYEKHHPVGRNGGENDKEASSDRDNSRTSQALRRSLETASRMFAHPRL